MYIRLLLVLAVLLLLLGAELLPKTLLAPRVTTSSTTSTGYFASTTLEEPVPDGALKRAVTTVFWVGEGATAENDYISNKASAWDTSWQSHYGGVDTPEDRCDFAPCTFTPKENPFYVALPYNEFTVDGARKASTVFIPWYEKVGLGSSLLKNRWVEVWYRGVTCYGQWEDVGPGEEDDFVYVFGTSTVPANTFGERAGLDISPALRDCLDAPDVSITYWRFVESSEVPEGPWRRTPTESGLSW